MQAITMMKVRCAPSRADRSCAESTRASLGVGASWSFGVPFEETFFEETFVGDPFFGDSGLAPLERARFRVGFDDAGVDGLDARGPRCEVRFDSEGPVRWAARASARRRTTARSSASTRRRATRSTRSRRLSWRARAR